MANAVTWQTQMEINDTPEVIVGHDRQQDDEICKTINSDMAQAVICIYKV